jgi:hypothetical protein
MTRATALVAAIAIAFFAVLIHMHYIDYAAATEGHLYVISRADSATTQRVLEERKQYLLKLSNAEILNNKNAYARCGLTKYGKPPKDTLDFNSYTPCWAIDSQADVLRKKMVAALYNQPVYFGLLPSHELSGSPSKRSSDAFWLGVILPLALAFLAIILSVTSSKRRSGS